MTATYYSLDGLRLIDYLEDNRIELNTILAAIKPKVFWDWLKWKLLQLWPERDYRRGGLMLVNLIRTPTMNRFMEFADKQCGLVAEASLWQATNEASRTRGMYDDVGDSGIMYKLSRNRSRVIY